MNEASEMSRNIGKHIIDILLSDSEPYGCFDDINPHTAELSTMGSARIGSLSLKNWITWESSLCLRYEGESV